jgi:1-acyl-sn-glycerol-3-phosphate acyltransferase
VAGGSLVQNIVIDKPYRFIPPHPSRFWNRVLGWWLPHSLWKNWGIATAEFRGTEHLKQSLVAGHGILLAPNHCRPCDPFVMGLLCKEMRQPVYCMASWHLFMQGAFQAWLLRQAGGFSVYREGMDREALKAATNILVEAQRPLIIFAEGMISRTNDLLGNLQEGTAFIARTAAKQRAKLTPPGQVVIHPIALKYFFQGDLNASVGQVLDEVETRLSWRPQHDVPLVERIAKVGEALLSLKEIEYMGRAQPGTTPERQAQLIDRLLVPLEKEWVGGRREPVTVERVKRLRTAILPDMVAGDISEEERARRWRQLADMYLAQQISLYPTDYVRSRPTKERILETVERFEEDLTDEARCHRPLRVVIQVGEAIVAAPGRDKSAAEDPIMTELEKKLQGMLDSLAAESQIWNPN